MAEARCLDAGVSAASRWAEGSERRWSASLHDRRAWGRLEAPPLAQGHSERSVGAQRSHSDLRHTGVKRVDEVKTELIERVLISGHCFAACFDQQPDGSAATQATHDFIRKLQSVVGARMYNLYTVPCSNFNVLLSLYNLYMVPCPNFNVHLSLYECMWFRQIIFLLICHYPPPSPMINICVYRPFRILINFSFIPALLPTWPRPHRRRACRR